MPRRTRLPRSILVLALLLAVAFGGTLWLRHREHKRSHDEASGKDRQAKLGPRVVVAPVRELAPARDVTLPAEVRAFFMSTLYAKIPGYVSEMRVDKGDFVHAGDILARVESPETDREILGALTDMEVKRKLHARLQRMLRGHYVSIQDVQNAQSALDLARSVLNRWQAIQQYEVVTAPFTGLITGRYIDPGALVPAPVSATESAMPLLDIADLGRVRIAVYVGQDVSPFVHAGTSVTLTQDGRPDVHVEAMVTRTAGAMDTRSRMMLCEVWLDNTKLRLQPGTFVREILHLRVNPLPTVPTEALFVRDNVDLVAVVHGTKVAFTRVQIGLDNGVLVQIPAGLQAGEVVALNLPADLDDGAVIQPVSEKKGPVSGVRP